MKTAAKTKTTRKILDALRIEPIRSRDEATAIAAATAELMAAQERASLTRDERIASLTLEFNVQIEEYGREIEKNVRRLSTWALANRQTEFGSKTAISLAGHKLAFRWGTGKVETVPGVKEADALDAILSEEDEAIAERFVSVKTSLNKNAILEAWRSSQAFREVLASCGLTVTKEERFHFEPDRDAVEAPAPIKTEKEVVA